MPIAPTYPGVYIEEVPSGVRTITGVATSVAAFVDFFRQGPLNEAVQIFGFADFEREFGGLHTLSEASYAIQQFFLNGGSEAWVVRVGAGAAAAATVLRDVPGTGGNQVLGVTAGQRIRGASVTNPGLWGNSLRVDVGYDTSDPTQLFNLALSEVGLQGGREMVLRTETFRNLTMNTGVPNNAVEVVNEGSRLVQLSRAASWAAARPAATGTLGNALPVPPRVPVSGANFRVNPGTGPQLCTINYGTNPAPTDYPGLRRYVEDGIRASNPDDPLLAGATVQLIGNGSGASPFRFHVLAGRAGSPFNPVTTLTFTNGPVGTTADDLRLNVVPNVQQHSLTGGADGTAPDAPALRGVAASKTGIHALEDVGLFNILCIPRAAELAPTDFAAVMAEAEAYCERRRAFLLVDIPPRIDTLAEMQAWMTQNDTLRHRNAAVYFPRPMIADPLNDNRLRSVGASGTVAGLYARTDVERGVWKAPAGIDARLRNVQDLAYLLTDAENGALNPMGINCLRNFPVYGNVCWGGRTLEGADQQASEWKYVPVRRLTLFLEESLYRGTKWVVFEPNDEPLWAQIRLNIGAFMHTLFRQGAFQGQTPKEAYFVKCDKETTTQNDINLGIVNILVGFAPLKPAEFVIIKIQQIAGQIQT
jgi:phage tail sheath protein FI